VECGPDLTAGEISDQVLNTINFSKSMKYNPFHISEAKGHLEAVNTIIANTKATEKSRGRFLIKGRRLYYTAMIATSGMKRREKKNFTTCVI
jgi:type IV secretion system protein VirD4